MFSSAAQVDPKNNLSNAPHELTRTGAGGGTSNHRPLHSANLIVWPPHHVAAVLDVSLNDAKRIQKECAARYLVERRRTCSSPASPPTTAELDPQSADHHHHHPVTRCPAAPSVPSSSFMMTDSNRHCAKRSRGSDSMPLILQRGEDGASATTLDASTKEAIMPTTTVGGFEGLTTTIFSMLTDGQTAVATGMEVFDRLMLGGLPRSMVTEIVGAAGSGKSVVAHSIAAHVTSRGQRVVVIDADGKWSSLLFKNISQRLAHSAALASPPIIDAMRCDRATSIFSPESSSSEVLAAMRRVDVIRSIRSLDDMKRNLAELQSLLINKSGLSLLIVDSFASLVRGSYSGHPEEIALRTEAVLSAMQDLKTIAEALRIAVVVTSHASSFDYQVHHRSAGSKNAFHHASEDHDSPHHAHASSASAALGTTFFHAVNTRLVLEESSIDGRRLRLLRVAKSPMCPPAAFELHMLNDGNGGGDEQTEAAGGPKVLGSASPQLLIELRELSVDAARAACAQLGIAARAHFAVMTNNFSHAAAPRFL